MKHVPARTCTANLLKLRPPIFSVLSLGFGSREMDDFVSRKAPLGAGLSRGICNKHKQRVSSKRPFYGGLGKGRPVAAERLVISRYVPAQRFCYA
jgi:hypothetical protein